jgi:hypothetical protein
MGAGSRQGCSASRARFYAEIRSDFLEALYKVNRFCASQVLSGIFYEAPYQHLIGAVSGETKCLLCLVAKV